MNEHRNIECFEGPSVTDFSDIQGQSCSFDRPYTRILVIGDEFAMKFYGMYKNRLPSGCLPRGEEECNLHVQYATFPVGTPPSIYYILDILGSYEFDPTTDIVLIALLHCDLLCFNHESGFCWAYQDLDYIRLADICAHYAALHRWILHKINGVNRPVSVQLLMPPAFHFTGYNERYFQYLNEVKHSSTKKFRKGERWLTMNERVQKLNEVYTSYITNSSIFKRHWNKYFRELHLLDVQHCINKVYNLDKYVLPQEQNLNRENYAIAEGRAPTHQPRSRYAPFSVDGIMPSHEGVVRILRQAKSNHHKSKLARDKYPELTLPRCYINEDDLTSSYSPENWEYVFCLARNWDRQLALQFHEYKEENKCTFPVITLSCRAQIPEMPLTK